MRTKTFWINILRWIVVLPGSIASLFIVYAISYVGNHIFNRGMSSDLIIILISSFLCSAAFVFSGSYIAPMGKKNVAIVLCTIYVLIVVSSLIFSFSIYEGWSFFDMLLSQITNIVGSVVATVYIYKEDMDGK